jgi:hypothetical protein
MISSGGTACFTGFEGLWIAETGGRLLPSPGRSERLYPLGGPDESGHDQKAAREKDNFENVRADSAEIEQAGHRPASGEGRAKHLRPDQNGGAYHREHIDPEDPACGRGFDGFVHDLVLWAAQSSSNRAADQALDLFAGAPF